MIKFEQIVPKKKYFIYQDEEVIAELDLVTPSSISNKFELITEFIEGMITSLGTECENWFSNFMKQQFIHTCNYCLKDPNSMCNIDLSERSITDLKTVCPNLEKYENIRADLILENIPIIIDYVNQYLESLNLDLSIFINEDKIKKTSILFTEDEIYEIIKLSSYLKVYSLISNSNLRLDMRIHKKIFNTFLQNINNSKEIINKIFEIIKIKTYRYKQTDQFMWEYIKMIQCKEIDLYIVEIFNFLMNNIMVLCQYNRNPITFFVTVVDTAIIWILRSVYKSTIVYNDESNVDIQTIKINNLKSYASNDTIGRIKSTAVSYVHQLLESLTNSQVMNFDQKLVMFQDRIGKIKQDSPLIEYLVFPILAKLTGIPYTHFRSLNPETSAMLSMYIKYLLSKTFSNFETLFYLLECYPDPTTTVAVKTSYKIKIELLNAFVNEYNRIKNYQGFEQCYNQRCLYEQIIGRVYGTKFLNIMTGEPVNYDRKKLEVDVITFYTYFFAEAMDNYFAMIQSELKKSF